MLAADMAAPFILTFGLSFIAAATAQSSLEERVWATVFYTYYGDRTPLVLPVTNTLTPLGAQQLYAAGANFRDRYVNPAPDVFSPNTAIEGISRERLDPDQIAVITTADQYTIASAQAFMQGLYPPLQNSTNSTFINGESELADGTNVNFPLNGYQYPQLYTASSYDENSIWVAGHNNCPMWDSSRSEYYRTANYNDLLVSNTDFYTSLEAKILNGVFINASVGYFDAYYIWDYLSYGAVHNSSINGSISSSDLLHARDLASQWVQGTAGNTSQYGLNPGDHIGTIAGRTLATQIVQSLQANIRYQGEYSKMTLVFGSYEPMVGLLALSNLPNPSNSQFAGLPLPGSSMVFELYSLVPSNDSSDSYPDPEDLNVRFLFRNGTDASASLISFPLFNRSPSQIGMTLEEFMLGMEDFMILSVADWCYTCSSGADFCPLTMAGSSPGSGTRSYGSDGSGMHPAIAGVIGAVIVLAILALIGLLAFLILGLRVRFYRSPNAKTKRRNELGGFKGGEKLASDQDLSIPKGKKEGGETRGHERVGSWELGQSTKAEEAQLPGFPSRTTRRPSYEDDEVLGVPVKPRESV